LAAEGAAAPGDGWGEAGGRQPAARSMSKGTTIAAAEQRRMTANVLSSIQLSGSDILLSGSSILRSGDATSGTNVSVQRTVGEWQHG